MSSLIKARWFQIIAAVLIIVAVGLTVRYFQAVAKIKRDCSTVTKYQPYVAAAEQTPNWPDCQKELLPYGVSTSASCHPSVVGQEEKTLTVQATAEEYKACVQRRGLR